MDTNDLITHTRSRFDYAASKRTLKEKYQGKLVFGHNGSMFKATPEMIAFLSLYNNDKVVIVDLYENPVEVAANELCDIMRNKLQQQMNAWLLEYQELNKNK